MYRTQVSLSQPSTLGSQSISKLTNPASFAWMEMMKAMATLFRLFEVRRLRDDATVLREGFFVKSTECWVAIKHRS